MVSSKPEDKSYRETLDRRLVKARGNVLDARATLVHFALITYALPKSRLDPYVPLDRLEIPEFCIDGTRQALVSAVTFYVDGFRFAKLAPFIRFRFGQTNYRLMSSTARRGSMRSGSSAPPWARDLCTCPGHSGRYRGIVLDTSWTADLIGFGVLTTITNSRSRPHGLQPRLRSTTPGRRPFSRKDSRQRSK